MENLKSSIAWLNSYSYNSNIVVNLLNSIMKDTQEKQLFTEITTEESATVNGGYCGYVYRPSSYYYGPRRYYSKPVSYGYNNCGYNRCGYNGYGY